MTADEIRDARAASANTNPLLIPAGEGVARLCQDPALAAVAVALAGVCRLAPVSVSNAAHDTLRAVASLINGPARSALVELAHALLLDGNSRHEWERAARQPDQFDAEGVAELVRRDSVAAKWLTRLATD